MRTLSLVDKKYGLKIASPEAARQILQSVTTMSDAVVAHLDFKTAPLEPLAGPAN